MASQGLKRPFDFEIGPHLKTDPLEGTSQNDIIANMSKRRCSTFSIQPQRFHNPYSAQTNLSNTNDSSPFKDPSNILTSPREQIASVIQTEIHRSNLEDNQHNQQHQHQNNPQQQQKSAEDIPVLTVRQAQTICERLIREREQKLKDEYDKVLINKLAEQYDTFVKYTHDHIEKRYHQSSSYQTSYLS